jgi:phage shock protein C
MVTQQRLTRSTTDKVFGGVCGGLGQYFGIDPVIVRLIMVALFFAGGISLVLYPLLWLIVPADNGTPQTFGQTVHEMQREAQHWGQQATQQVQSTFATPRYDPQTGQPVGAASHERRNKTLGIVLLGLGGLMLASFIDASPIVIALLILGAGAYFLRRG